MARAVTHAEVRLMASLEDRVSALEVLASTVQVTEGSIDDAAARAVRDAAMVAGLTGAALVRVPADYYEWPLEARAALLACPVAALCKTLVFENVSAVGAGAQVGDARHVAFVLQYTSRLDVSTLEAFLRRRSTRGAVSLRAAVDVASVTGFGPGGVTSIGCPPAVPVLVSKAVSLLPAAGVPFVWLGGGHALVKLRVCVRELCAMAAGVAECTHERDGESSD